MKRLIMFALFVSVFSIPLCAQADTGPKIWAFGWGGAHWAHQDFMPYIEDAKHPHNGQWGDTCWTPDHWGRQHPEGKEGVLDGFFTAGILADMYTKRGVPVLEIGPNFYHLGGRDQRRVLETVDSVYQVTSRDENGMFMLYDWGSHKPVGAYTTYGLHLQ